MTMNVTPLATPEEQSLGSKTRILVVDDDQICGDAIAGVLRAACY